jgi:hypothetical protein
MLPVTLIAIRARLARLALVAVMSAGALPSAVAEESRTRSGLAALEVEASSACTTRAELIARVRARAPAASFVDVGAAVAISVRFSAARAGAIVAEVTFTSGGAKPSARRVEAGTCREATDAVALIIAMTLSPPGNRGDGSGDSPASAGAASDQSTSSSPESPTATRKPASPAERVEPAREAIDPTSPPTANVGSFGVQLAAQAFVGPAPQVMPGVAVYALAGLERRAPWSPAILLGASRAWQRGTQEEGGKASFTLDSMTFDACPVRLRLAGIETRPCGSLLVGRFSARGTDTINQAPESRRPFWVVGGAVVASKDLFWLLEASARVAVGANLVRDSFEFTPSVFHTVPAITVAASAGVGVRWR